MEWWGSVRIRGKAGVAGIPPGCEFPIELPGVRPKRNSHPGGMPKTSASSRTGRTTRPPPPPAQLSPKPTPHLQLSCAPSKNATASWSARGLTPPCDRNAAASHPGLPPKGDDNQPEAANSATPPPNHPSSPRPSPTPNSFRRSISHNLPPTSVRGRRQAAGTPRRGRASDLPELAEASSRLSTSNPATG
jgi:hypothetical protein